MVTYEGNKPYVFISYAHKDKGKVLPVIQGLQDRGFRVWYDGGVEVGNEWPDFIAEHLEQCACVLTFVSRKFGESHNCRQEFTFAQNLHKDNSIVYLEDPALLRAGMRMQLSNLHAMYLEHYANTKTFLDELSKATVLKQCMGDVTSVPTYTKNTALSAIKPAPPKQAKPAGPDADKLFIQAEMHYMWKEFGKAVHLYRRAAEKGHAKSQYKLGVCYECGDGVSQNSEEAVKWFRRAAEQGDASAQYSLGYCYDMSQGVPWNTAEAEKWYLKAAKQGHVDAQFNLGSFYEHGIGSRQDWGEARKWYRKAAAQGDVDAIEKLKTF